MSALLFLFGFLATGIMGAITLASFEIERTEQIGAEGFLFLLCVCASVFSVLSYLVGAHRFQRSSVSIAGLFGGLSAAGILYAAVAATNYLRCDFAFSVILALVLSSLTAFIWPLLTAKAQNA